MPNEKFQIDFAGRALSAEFSDLAEHAHGSAIVRYGETMVMATAVMSDFKRENIDYFPLTVDYEEKFYAAGRILGSRFLRREGRPSEEAILTGRMIDRTLRPLFDKKIRNEVQVIAIALSVDGENSPDVPAIIAASLALATSHIPWDGPISAVRVAKVNDEFIVNPQSNQLEKAELDIVVCAKNQTINMIELEAKEMPEKDVLKALETALPELEKLNKFQKEIVEKIGQEKKWPEIDQEPEGLKELFEKQIKKRLEEKNAVLGELKKEWLEAAEKEFGEKSKALAAQFYENALDEITHKNIIEKNIRPDNRKLDEVRKLKSAIGLLPRVHGSGVFYRGQTHVLSVATLGAPGDVLLIEGMEIQEKKRFMHHYNFPPFAPGETGKMSGPGRREIGHGALAEKALKNLLPGPEEFPYTIRVVSEVLSSNGSTSMASVSASSLALMDSGVPLKNPAAGIAIGLMLEQETNYKILTDIQGPEDHHGDMDFKVAGTKRGVTAIQMDVKVDGVPLNILKEALEAAKKAREEILKNMAEAIKEPKKELSPYAPHIITIAINPEKIRDVVGPGGKIINKIIFDTGAEIDIEQTGKIFITGKNRADAQKAAKIIEEIAHEYEIGESFKGKVSRIFDFGAMVQINDNGQEGLVHISELAPFRVNKVEDVVKVGDVIPVKIIEIDEKGRVNLSLKQIDPDYARRKTGKVDEQKSKQ